MHERFAIALFDNHLVAPSFACNVARMTSVNRNNANCSAVCVLLHRHALRNVCFSGNRDVGKNVTLARLSVIPSVTKRRSAIESRDVSRNSALVCIRDRRNSLNGRPSTCLLEC